MMSDFFDTMGSVIALGMQGGFVRDGKLPRIKGVLVADSLAASIGGLFGASSVTTYIESASGVAEGGRTGLTSVIVSLLFLASAFFAPVAAMIGIPLTYSISHGIGLGFVSYTLIKMARGKFREVHPLLYVVSVAFGVTFVIHWINGLFGSV